MIFLTDFVGFVGCIRNVIVQKEFLDPINLMERPSGGVSQAGLILDGCKLVDHCLVHQHCQHGGQCLSDWDGVSCDCSSSAYQGKYCQFGKHFTFFHYLLYKLYFHSYPFSLPLNSVFFTISLAQQSILLGFLGT